MMEVGLQIGFEKFLAVETVCSYSNLSLFPLDVSAMKERLQFSPQMTLEEGLKNTINWYENQFP